MLPAGHSLGTFLHLQLPREGHAALTVQVDGHQRDFGLVVRQHRRGALVVENLDEAGQATAARVYLTATDHRAHAPAGVMHRLESGEANQPFAGGADFLAAGKFSVDLPVGPAVLEIVKGLEYEPVRLPVQIRAGPPANVTVRFKRRWILQQAGWYSGNVHVHANLFTQDVIKPADVLLVAQAEDLNVVSIIPCNDPRTATINDGKYFTGGPDAVSTPDRVVVFCEEMRNDIFGHVGFLNLKSFVELAFFGWPNSPHHHDYPGNYPQAAQARVQGGVCPSRFVQRVACRHRSGRGGHDRRDEPERLGPADGLVVSVAELRLPMSDFRRHRFLP
ncbi:MAG: hypothetical protein EXS33_00055 [Pedosphaera sp.]|nr:hypothetical protein [Pedosphaera sp.]